MPSSTLLILRLARRSNADVGPWWMFLLGRLPKPVLQRQAKLSLPKPSLLTLKRRSFSQRPLAPATPWANCSINSLQATFREQRKKSKAPGLRKAKGTPKHLMHSRTPMPSPASEVDSMTADPLLRVLAWRTSMQSQRSIWSLRACIH